MARIGTETIVISLIACSLAVATAKQFTRFQSGLECQESGYFRDVTDCRKFYYCPTIPEAETRLNPEERQALNEITRLGLECPEGSIFDEPSASCQRMILMDIIPPECKYPESREPDYVPTGEVSEIDNNY